MLSGRFTMKYSIEVYLPPNLNQNEFQYEIRTLKEYFEETLHLIL